MHNALAYVCWMFDTTGIRVALCSSWLEYVDTHLHTWTHRQAVSMDPQIPPDRNWYSAIKRASLALEVLKWRMRRGSLLVSSGGHRVPQNRSSILFGCRWPSNVTPRLPWSQLKHTIGIWRNVTCTINSIKCTSLWETRNHFFRVKKTNVLNIRYI